MCDSSPVRQLRLGSPTCSPACRMRAHWWSCVLGILCMPAEVVLGFRMVSQEPMSISLRVNSSAEIKCSTLLPGADGFTLNRYLNGNSRIVHLFLVNGEINKTTKAKGFRERLIVSPDRQISEGQGFTLHFSMLGEEDTDVYFCSWSYSVQSTSRTYTGQGTIIILRENHPEEQCSYPILEHILMISSVTAFIVVSVSIIGALIVRCNRFKTHFRPDRVETPARPARPTRPTRPHHVSPQQTFQHHPYLVTAVNSSEGRGLL